MCSPPAAIAAKSRRFYGQEIDPDKHVTVTCGVTEAVIAAVHQRSGKIDWIVAPVQLSALLAKSPAFVPVNVIAVICRLDVPVFVTVMVCAVLALPTP